jgi:hypothetical protein
VDGAGELEGGEGGEEGGRGGGGGEFEVGGARGGGDEAGFEDWSGEVSRVLKRGLE